MTISAPATAMAGFGVPSQALWRSRARVYAGWPEYRQPGPPSEGGSDILCLVAALHCARHVEERAVGTGRWHNRYQRHLANGTISNPTDLIVAWLRWYVPAPIRSRLHCEGSPEAVGTRFLTTRCLVMAANHLNRVLIDNSEFLEAVELMLLRRNVCFSCRASRHRQGN